MLHDKQATLLCFPVWKRVERLVQCKPLFLEFLCLDTRRGGGRPQGYVRERLVVVIRSFWKFARTRKASLGEENVESCWAHELHSLGVLYYRGCNIGLRRCTILHRTVGGCMSSAINASDAWIELSWFGETGSDGAGRMPCT